jgi:hypothetical protein
MTTLFIQDNFEYDFFNLPSFIYITVILFSAKDKSRDPGANWIQLEHM